MSRVGLKPIKLPEGVSVQIEGRTVSAKGSKGEMTYQIPEGLEVKLEDGVVSVSPKNESRQTKMLWGTTRARIANIVAGTSEGASKTLEVQGVGYRAKMQGKNLVLQLGFSHDVVYPTPEGITISCPSPNQVVVTGSDHQRVGQVASELRSYRPPEPYKGKGVRLQGEYVKRKEGKKK